jgi:hypothetical protein
MEREATLVLKSHALLWLIMLHTCQRVKLFPPHRAARGLHPAVRGTSYAPTFSPDERLQPTSHPHIAQARGRTPHNTSIHALLTQSTPCILTEPTAHARRICCLSRRTPRPRRRRACCRRTTIRLRYGYVLRHRRYEPGSASAGCSPAHSHTRTARCRPPHFPRCRPNLWLRNRRSSTVARSTGDASSSCAARPLCAAHMHQDTGKRAHAGRRAAHDAPSPRQRRVIFVYYFRRRRHRHAPLSIHPANCSKTP